jgi:hypothetical protein
MAFDEELGVTLREAVRAEGFPLDKEYCGRVAMIEGVRRIASLPSGEPLTADLTAALLENFRAAVNTTIASGNVAAISAQSQLPRWAHLRTASVTAADGYVRALRIAGIRVPDTLVEPSSV